MKASVLFGAAFSMTLLVCSCTGVKNVSGTLKKTDGSERRSSSYTDYSQVGTNRTVSDSVHRQTSPQPAAGEYRRDYSQLASASAPPAQSSVAPTTENVARLRQYEEMDRLADLVVYEIDILQKRWDQLLARYKTASQAEREGISRDLDLVSADQLKLYRAHVHIYRDGKQDWPLVKKEVENVLLVIRGVNR